MICLGAVNAEGGTGGKMKEELIKKQVLAMYDVRGIQNYIFRTNYIKEIVGASAIVENIMTEGMRKIIETEPDWDEKRFLIDWEKDLAQGQDFFGNPDVQMQVLFIGGGNAYVLFRSGQICREMNRRLSKYVLERTYSLRLAVAVVEYTGNYSADYEAINLEMREVKAHMPEGRPLGAMPFMAVDSVTGFPLSHYEQYEEKNYLSTESWLKRKKYDEISNVAPENILDNMVTEKGDNSSLAVIHIDGNNMGKRIKDIMQDKEKYPEAVRAMRTISANIRDGFKEAFQVMADYIDRNLSDRIKENRKGKLYRKLILAGDDVTFICNAMVALDAVPVFLRHVMTKKMYNDSNLTEKENLRRYGFSACGGIAFIYSHFPFRDAYEVAEACCGSAKARAKKPENRQKENLGSFFDYQICSHISAANLSAYRKKHYMLAGESELIIRRPYYVGSEVLDSICDLNERNKEYDFEILRETICSFLKNIPRGQAKTLRNSCAMGAREAEKYITFLKSRDAVLPDSERGYWYDALEVMDLYPGKEGAKDETEDNAAE